MAMKKIMIPQRIDIMGVGKGFPYTVPLWFIGLPYYYMTEEREDKEVQVGE